MLWSDVLKWSEEAGVEWGEMRLKEVVTLQEHCRVASSICIERTH